MTKNLKLYIFLGLFLVGLLAGWQTRTWYESAKDLAASIATQKMIDMFMDKESEVSKQVEIKLQELKANETIIEKHINTIVERPVYRNNCLDDDGLRLINNILKSDPAEFTFEMSEQPNTLRGFEWKSDNVESVRLE